MKKVLNVILSAMLIFGFVQVASNYAGAQIGEIEGGVGAEPQPGIVYPADDTDTGIGDCGSKTLEKCTPEVECKGSSGTSKCKGDATPKRSCSCYNGNCCATKKSSGVVDPVEEVNLE